MSKTISTYFLSENDSNPTHNFCWTQVLAWDFYQLGALLVNNKNDVAKRYNEYKKFPQVVEKFVSRYPSFMGYLAIEAIKHRDKEFLHELFFSRNIHAGTRWLPLFAFVQTISHHKKHGIKDDDILVMFEKEFYPLLKDMFEKDFLPAVINHMMLDNNSVCLKALIQHKTWKQEPERVDQALASLMNKFNATELMQTLEQQDDMRMKMALSYQRNPDVFHNQTKDLPSWGPFFNLLFNNQLKKDLLKSQPCSRPKKI